MKTIVDFHPSLKSKSCQESCGPCPWCGGKDRFIVWQNKGRGGRFYCRQCQEKGDGIDFLRKNGMSFRESVAALGLGDIDSPQISRPLAKLDKLALDQSSMLPKEQWRKAAKQYLDKTWADTQSLRYPEYVELMGQRYLSMETARRFKICWQPQDVYFQATDWSLDGKKIRIPKGLVIPTYKDGEIVALKVRCFDRVQNPKYWQIKGGAPQPLVLGASDIPIVVVESELDGYLIWQETHDKVAIVALGGISKPITGNIFDFLNQAPKVLIATDFDPAEDGSLGPGQKALSCLKKQLNNAEYYPPALGKDPTEMVDAGIPIGDWLVQIVPGLNTCVLPAIPPGYPGTLDGLRRDLKSSPDLVPCPVLKQRWYWRYRSDCPACPGHIHCIKDFIE